jgi:HEAT repeat protein
MNANEIIQLLETPTEDRRPIIDKIVQEAPISELIAAMQQVHMTPLIRQLLCDMLGKRADKQAITVLSEALQNPSSKVRSSAADALAKIGDFQAGEALMKSLEVEENSDVQSALIFALGSVGYKPAIPIIIQTLSNPSDMIRYCSTRALEDLHAEQAKDALEQAIANETDSYTAQRMRKALQTLGGAS